VALAVGPGLISPPLLLAHATSPSVAISAALVIVDAMGASPSDQERTALLELDMCEPNEGLRARPDRRGRRGTSFACHRGAIRASRTLRRKEMTMKKSIATGLLAMCLALPLGGVASAAGNDPPNPGQAVHDVGNAAQNIGDKAGSSGGFGLFGLLGLVGLVGLFHGRHGRAYEGRGHEGMGREGRGNEPMPDQGFRRQDPVESR
jgi:hypothetical protein